MLYFPLPPAGVPPVSDAPNRSPSPLSLGVDALRQVAVAQSGPTVGCWQFPDAPSQFPSPTSVKVLLPVGSNGASRASPAISLPSPTTNYQPLTAGPDLPASFKPRFMSLNDNRVAPLNPSQILVPKPSMNGGQARGDSRAVPLGFKQLLPKPSMNGGGRGEPVVPGEEEEELRNAAVRKVGHRGQNRFSPYLR